MTRIAKLTRMIEDIPAIARAGMLIRIEGGAWKVRWEAMNVDDAQVIIYQSTYSSSGEQIVQIPAKGTTVTLDIGDGTRPPSIKIEGKSRAVRLQGLPTRIEVMI